MIRVLNKQVEQSIGIQGYNKTNTIKLLYQKVTLVMVKLTVTDIHITDTVYIWQT